MSKKKTWFDLYNHITGYRLVTRSRQEIFLLEKANLKTMDQIYEQRMFKKEL